MRVTLHVLHYSFSRELTSVLQQLQQLLVGVSQQHFPLAMFIFFSVSFSFSISYCSDFNKMCTGLNVSSHVRMCVFSPDLQLHDKGAAVYTIHHTSYTSNITQGTVLMLAWKSELQVDTTCCRKSFAMCIYKYLNSDFCFRVKWVSQDNQAPQAHLESLAWLDLLDCQGRARTGKV